MVSENRRHEDEMCGDAALYVLGLLEPEEAVRFLQHARSCVVCRDEIGSLEQAVDLLGESAPPLRAPRQLRARVMRAIAAEAQVSRFADRSVATRWLAPRALVAVVSFCALLAAAGAVGALLFGSSSKTTPSSSITATVSYPHAQAVLHRSGARLWLTVSHMPLPGKGRIYEVWIERGQAAPAPTAALFAPTARGAGEVAIPSSALKASEVLVTSEPEGGTLAPTRTPVIVARLAKPS
jgi:anti-sigma-K factor RskA